MAQHSNMIAREPREEVDRAAVFKQRRLIIGFSFALAAIHALDVKLSRNVSMQGLVLTFERPYLLVIALWFAWAWALWRYWQYERTYRHERVEGLRANERSERALRIVEQMIQRDIDAGSYKDRGINPGDKVRVYGAPKTQSPSSEWVYSGLQLAMLTPGAKQVSVDKHFSCTLSVSQVERIYRESEIAIGFGYPYFSDFKVVYLFAAFAPIAGLIDMALWVYGRWHAS